MFQSLVATLSLAAAVAHAQTLESGLADAAGALKTHRTARIAAVRAASPVPSRAPSKLPAELRGSILVRIARDCPKALNIEEGETSVREEHVDQGVRDFYYTTKFKVRWYFDGMHPTGDVITVKSVKYGGAVVIESVESWGGVCRSDR